MSRDTTPTLSVTNLRTHFFTKEGVAKAVDGVDFGFDLSVGVAGSGGEGAIFAEFI